jgi:hypothetical protein
MSMTLMAGPDADVAGLTDEAAAVDAAGALDDGPVDAAAAGALDDGPVLVDAVDAADALDDEPPDALDFDELLHAASTTSGSTASAVPSWSLFVPTCTSKEAVDLADRGCRNVARGGTVVNT